MKSFSIDCINFDITCVKSAVENSDIILVTTKNDVEIRIPKTHYGNFSAKDFVEEKMIVDECPKTETFDYADVEIPGCGLKYGDVVGSSRDSNEIKIKLLTTSGAIFTLDVEDYEADIINQRICGKIDEKFHGLEINGFYTMRNKKKIFYEKSRTSDFTTFERYSDSAFMTFKYNGEFRMIKQNIADYYNSKNSMKVLDKNRIPVFRFWEI